MKQPVIACVCLAAALAAAPLAAQTPSPRTDSPSPATTPNSPESRTSGGALRAEVPRPRTIDDATSASPGGRVSETAPTPRVSRGEGRFRADLASCTTLEPESRASCRQEMYAARAQGMYRE
jgi:hypothetical protein